MAGPGGMTERVLFEPPRSTPDQYGGIETGWDAAAGVQSAAAFRWLRGGEVVQAARLEGRQPVVVTIWSTAAARAITTAWRMTDTRTGIAYNIRSIVPTDDRLRLELTCESGVAV